MGTVKEDHAGNLRMGLPVRKGLGSSFTFTLLLLYLFALPLKFQVRWLLVYVQLALFVALGLRVVAGLHRITLTRTQLAVVVILGVTVCVTIFGHVFAEQGENLGKVPQVTRFLVIALACALELDSAERIQHVLTAIASIGALVGLLSVVNVFVTLPFAFTGQVRSLGPLPFATPRSLGIWMSFGSYGVLALIGASYTGMSAFRPTALYNTRRSSYSRAFATVALSLILIGVYLGKSRSTVLAFLLVSAWGLAIAAFHPDSRLRAATPAVPAGILLGGIAGVSLKSASILDAFVSANSASVTGRLDQYQFALDLMLQRPLLGWGWQYFETTFGTSYTVHNLWFLVGISLGIPVLLLWVYLFVRLALSTLRRVTDENPQIRAFSVIGMAMVVGGAVELALYPGFTPAAAVLIGLLTGIVGLGKDRPEAALASAD